MKKFWKGFKGKGIIVFLFYLAIVHGGIAGCGCRKGVPEAEEFRKICKDITAETIEVKGEKLVQTLENAARTREKWPEELSKRAEGVISASKELASIDSEIKKIEKGVTDLDPEKDNLDGIGNPAADVSRMMELTGKKAAARARLVEAAEIFCRTYLKY